MVLSGSVQCGEQRLERWENVFSSNAGELPPLAAGPQGAQVISLFTPVLSAAYL